MFLSKKDQKAIKKYLGSMENPVELRVSMDYLRFFKQSKQYFMIKETGKIIPKIQVKGYGSKLHSITAEPNYTLIENEKIKQNILLKTCEQYRIRYYGNIIGLEIGSFLEIIKRFSKRDLGLPEWLLEDLNQIQHPIHIDVVVGSRCKYCPHAVVNAQKLALASSNISAYMINKEDAPRMADRYLIDHVPVTFINKKQAFIGIITPEEIFNQHIKSLL